ncbi:hypothetical protein [Tessaracoccus terricola]
MNTMHLPPTAHPPEQFLVAETITDLPQIPGASLADRISMRIGLWLLLRGARHAARDEQCRQLNDLEHVSDAARDEHAQALARAWAQGAQSPFQR